MSDPLPPQTDGKSPQKSPQLIKKSTKVRSPKEPGSGFWSRSLPATRTRRWTGFAAALLVVAYGGFIGSRERTGWGKRKEPHSMSAAGDKQPRLTKSVSRHRCHPV